MVDESGENGFPMLSAEEVIAFFEKVGANRNCPICNGDRWHLLGVEEQVLATVPVLSNGETSTNEASKNLPVITVICANCFFLRMHPVGLIESSMEKKAEADKLGDGNGSND